MLKVVPCILLVLVVVNRAENQTDSDENAGQESAAKNSTSLKGKKSAADIYRNLFRMKRKDQIRAVETVLIMEDVEKQHKMIAIMLATIVKTIEHGKGIVTEAGFKAGDAFPEKSDVKDGLSMVLENTALFTDLIVRFPFVAQIELKKNYDSWMETMKWAKIVCEKSGVYVEKHSKILHSLGQELGIDDPDPEYSNPFKTKPRIDPKTSEDRVREYEESKRKEKLAKKKKNRKSGPKLSKSEL